MYAVVSLSMRDLTRRLPRVGHQLPVTPSYQCTQPRVTAASGVCPLPCPARGRVRPGNVSMGAVRVLASAVVQVEPHVSLRDVRCSALGS